MNREAPMEDDELLPPINVQNEHAVFSGQNLPNHSTTQAGRGKFVAAGGLQFRTNQQIYRFCAHLLKEAQTAGLPNETGDHSFYDVMEAVYPGYFSDVLEIDSPNY